MKVLNKAQVDALFRREAVLLGTADVVPDFRAAALFGEDAVKLVESEKNAGHEWNIYGDVTYLSYRGFLAAASFYNERQFRESTATNEKMPVFTSFYLLKAATVNNQIKHINGPLTPLFLYLIYGANRCGTIVWGGGGIPPVSGPADRKDGNNGNSQEARGQARPQLSNTVLLWV